MTVPPLFGWESIATVVVVAAVVAVVAVVLLQTGRDIHGRSEWQAWLDGRSADLRQLRDDDRPAPSAPVGDADGRSSAAAPTVVVRHRAPCRAPRP